MSFDLAGKRVSCVCELALRSCAKIMQHYVVSVNDANHAALYSEDILVGPVKST